MNSPPNAAKTEGSKLRPLVWLLIGYLVLLGVSHLVRHLQPDPWPLAESMQTLGLTSNGSGEPTVSPVQIRYFDVGPEDGNGQPVILLIHGSPVAASRGFQGLMRDLSPAGRVIMPDLPGFGYSTRALPDYGFKTHADYLRRLTETLQLDRVHLVAYSMGGGAALHLADQMPQKIASLTLVSSIGVQELELMGDYHINHALHGVQLLFFWVLQECVPHMGWLDRIPLNLNYARNFFDSDQRPLRALLKRISAPTLILHAENDYFVPLAAARESHRLLPQSALKLLPGGHLFVFNRPQQAADEISTFIARVQTGNAAARAVADAGRLAAARVPFQQVDTDSAAGALLLTYMLLIALATLVSEDLACIAAGLMAAKGIIGFGAAAGAALIGIVGGDLLLFLAGKYLGRPAVHKRPLKWIVKPRDLDRAAHWFRAKGPAIIISSRFLPGSRLPTYVAAGILDGRVFYFLFYFSIAAFLWTPALVGAAMGVGSSLMAYFSVYQRYALWVVAAALLMLWALPRLVVPMFSFRGRRMLLAAYRRKRRWQSLPVWALYAPVLAYALYLGVRRGRSTLFTAANPAMPAGGFGRVSKSAVLCALDSSDAVPFHILIDRHLGLDQQIARVRAFMDDCGLVFPVVFKPDSGQRGQGVAIIRAAEQMAPYFEHAQDDTLVQQYVHGREFGVFYYRNPDEPAGRILSVTEKRFLTLTGDGKHTLEELILKDDRAVQRAALFFDTHRERLYAVPAVGKTIALVDVGTHTRGALFADATHLITPAMTRSFDRFSRGFDGFFCGRYDVRTPSVQDLQQGRNLAILELNGMSTEAIEIYDPANGLFDAWRLLVKQWKIAVDIGWVNHRRGFRVLPPRKILRLFFVGETRDQSR